MKKLFGTDGMRGAAGEFPLDLETIRVIGASLARQFIEKNGNAPKFLIGRDTRESGEWMEKAFCEGAATHGAECVSAGIITTPGVAFLTHDQNADAGIVISASHNPFHDNGIKIFSPTGKKIDEATERVIEKDISNADCIAKSEEFQAKSAEQRLTGDLQERYLIHLEQEFPALSLSNLKIVLDCANGAASDLAPRLFERFGATVTSIFNTPNGRNINADCGSLHIEKLQETVLAEKADFGVAFDGDADRALFVDEKGVFVDGDATLWAMACHLQNKNELKNDLVVATVMSNLGLENALKNRGIELRRTDVGDKYVLEELLKTNSALGGEQSGHIIFPRRSLVGDGMLTALFLLEAMQEKQSKLSDLIHGFERLPQILVNIRVREKLPFARVPKIAEAADEIESELGAKGRLLLRYSGTELLARVMIEGERQENIDEQANRLAAVIRQELGFN